MASSVSRSPCEGGRLSGNSPLPGNFLPHPPPLPPAAHINKLLFFGTAQQLRSRWSGEGRSCWSVAASSFGWASPVASSASGCRLCLASPSFPSLPIYMLPCNLFLLSTCRCWSCYFLGTSGAPVRTAWWFLSPSLLSSLLLPLAPSLTLSGQSPYPFGARGCRAASLGSVQPETDLQLGWPWGDCGLFWWKRLCQGPWILG